MPATPTNLRTDPPASETSAAEPDLEQFIPYLMNSIIARYNRGVEKLLRPVAISVPHMRTLAVLAREGSRTINELSARCVTQQSTMSRTLDSMEAAGLITREAGSKDNRVRHIQLTDAGRRAYEQCWPDVEQVADRAFAALTPDERELLAGMLARVLHDGWRHDC